MIGTLLSHFRITASLGAGGMGEVYRATDTRLGREVALKLLPDDFALDPERHARFEREAKTLAALNHPGIATLYGLEHLEGRHVLVMELVEGEGLDERIARGPVPVQDALPIALQIAEALEAAHEHGIIHRDLKPANVKVRPDGTVKVLDFGLAKTWESEGADGSLSLSPTITAHHTKAGVILGTAAYMAPEQARGKSVDRRADVWAFGVVLWEMLTGRRLFEGETVTDVIAAVVTREPDWHAVPSETPPTVRRLLTRCLRKDPRSRQPDIASVRFELSEIASETGVLVERDGGSDARPASLGGRRAIAIAAATVVVGVMIGILLDRAIGVPRPSARVVEFGVQPPADTTFYLDPERPGAAMISPDGTAITFTAATEGTFRLYVRDLSSSVARAVPGTGGAQYPFWSPDSRFVGFFADGKLRKVQVSGGTSPPVTICEAEEVKGASWGSAGVIVFAPNAGSGLQRVPDSGGVPAPLTELDPSAGEDSHRHPRFLPDGRHFLYLARVAGGTPDNRVLVGSLAGGTPKHILTSPAAAQYASGYLLFVREGTLMAQRFDVKRLELSGEAFPVAEDVRLIAGATALAVFSASNDGTLAYQTGGMTAARKLVWRDREGKATGSLGDETTYWDLALSPAGDQAAVNLSVTSGSADLWLYDIARDVRTRLTFDARDEWGLAWTADGTALAFSSDRGGQYDLYRIAVSGTSPETLLYRSDETKLPTGFSPDGRLLMFEVQRQETGWDLWLLPLDGESKPHPFIEVADDQMQGVFSPDGRWVAYASYESGHAEIYAVPFPGTGRKWQISTRGGTWPAWRGDGREIFYRAADSTITAVPVEARGDTLTIGPPKPLFFMPTPESNNSRYAPTADGSRFLNIEPVAAQVSRPLTVVLNWTATAPGRQ